MALNILALVIQITAVTQKHKDKERTCVYINRHKKKEDWSKSNIAPPAWMSRHILWEQTDSQRCC